MAATTIRVRGVHKSVEIFLDIDWLKDHAPVTDRLGVFDQNSGGTIDAPHPKTCPKKSAVRVKLLQPCHCMETINRDSILAIKAAVRPISPKPYVYEILPTYTN